jgi:hypothetical protein
MRIIIAFLLMLMIFDLSSAIGQTINIKDSTSKKSNSTPKNSKQVKTTINTQTKNVKPVKLNTIIDLQTNRAYSEIKVDTTGLINIEKLTDTIVVIFPDKNLTKYSLQFNDSKDTSTKMFTLSFNCEDGDDK